MKKAVASQIKNAIKALDMALWTVPAMPLRRKLSDERTVLYQTLINNHWEFDLSYHLKRMKGPDIQECVACLPPSDMVDSAKMVVRHLKRMKYDRERENFILFALNSALRVLWKKVMFMGCEDRIDNIYVKTLIRELLKSKKATPKVLIAHNHPSGDPNPSESDIEFTRLAKKSFDLLDLDLIDHVIVGDGSSYTSMKEQNYF